MYNSVVYFGRDGVSSWELQVIAGEHLLDTREGNEQTLNVDEIYMHPSYNSQNRMDHDVALLKLNGRVQYSGSVLPICLPRNDVQAGHTCTVTGWGDTQGMVHSNKQIGNLKIGLRTNLSMDISFYRDWERFNFESG